MTKKEAGARIEKLKKLVNRYRYLYHVLDRQEISDSALDSLKKELFDLEQEFPEFITPDSPTQRVAGKPLDKFEKTRHSQPMISFNDTFSEQDMRDWFARISKLITKEEISQIDYYCELKIDGLAIELVYQNGLFEIGSTRGDGVIGENVTLNLKTIDAIPLQIRNKNEIVADLKKEGVGPSIISAVKKYDLKEPLIVRGEVFIPKKEFEKGNKEQQRKGLSLYANPRNLAAGSVRQLDPKITASRRLDSFAYELLTNFNQSTHEEKHKILKAFGFKTNPKNKYCKNLSEVFSFYNYVQKIREGLGYEIDGIVVIINPNKIFDKLGVIGKAPRGAVAFKFPLKQATTIVENIEVQIGRTGALTPVAILKPVQVSGITISRATLHNEDEIRRLGLKIGDTVIVGRAGDVIPDIIKVLGELRTGREKEFKMPVTCPLCGSPVKKNKGEVISYCTNLNCFARQKEYLHHFVSKGAFNIVGLGPKIIDRLFEKGVIGDSADLFYLKEGDIKPLERFGEKSAKNLINSIQRCKEISFQRFIYSLGIRNVGEKTAYDLSRNFRSAKDLSKAGLTGLQGIRDIGPVVAGSIYDWFSQKKNIAFIKKLLKAGVKIKKETISAQERKLEHLTFVITGALNAMSRGKAEDRIRELGGNPVKSVSKKTDYLVTGQNAGLKLEKAKKLNVRIISEERFLELIR